MQDNEEILQLQEEEFLWEKPEMIYQNYSALSFSINIYYSQKTSTLKTSEL